MSISFSENFAVVRLFINKSGIRQSHWGGLDSEPNILSKFEEDCINIVALEGKQDFTKIWPTF